MIEPFKYVLQAVAIERDDQTGRVIKEHPAEPVHVYSAAQASDAILKFEEELAKAGESSGDPTTNAVSPPLSGEVTSHAG